VTTQRTPSGQRYLPCMILRDSSIRNIRDSRRREKRGQQNAARRRKILLAILDGNFPSAGALL